MFSTTNIILKMNNVKHNGYLQDELKKLINEDPHYVEAILDNFKIKGSWNLKTEDPLTPSQDSIAERVKLRNE